MGLQRGAGGDNKAVLEGHENFEIATFEKTISRRKLSTKVIVSNLTFKKKITSLNDIALTINTLIDTAINDSGLGTGAQFCISLSHPGFRERSFHFPARTRATISGESILNQLEAMMQSNDQLALDEKFSLEFYMWPAPPPSSQTG